VGGLPALNVDYDNSISGRFVGIVALVVGLTMLALFIGFRSVLIAAKAVALNLLSVATAFGAVVLVFQDGFGVTLLGLAEPLGGNFPAIPVIVFAVVFGLSMDYEVFLVSRVAEARSAGMSDREAIVEGLARTGGLITSAAAIMIVVFAAFTLGDFVLMKILGFALSVAVLVDATVVRMAIGPALLMLAGKWNWWPGDTGGEADEEATTKNTKNAKLRRGQQKATNRPPIFLGVNSPRGSSDASREQFPLEVLRVLRVLRGRFLVSEEAARVANP
jgi:RND superfamily putative drug exporter